MKLLVVSAVFALVAVSGCSSSDSTADANADYCAALGELSTQLTELSSLVASNATVEELQNQREDVQRAASAVSAAADQVDDAVAAQIADAGHAFDQAMDDVPADATIQEAGQAYTDAAKDFNEALKSEFSQLGCK